MTIFTLLNRMAGAIRAEREDRTATEPSPPRPERDSSLRRLRRAAESNDKLWPLVRAVENGDMRVTEAMIQAGLRKPRSRVANLRAEWDRATDNERAEFLAYVRAMEFDDLAAAETAEDDAAKREPSLTDTPIGQLPLPKLMAHLNKDGGP
jgi:hypothetical protein